MLFLLGAWLCLSCKFVLAGWHTYERCRVLSNEFADGDSFHVKTRSRHYIFRLYFVDAPETDKRYPERLTLQSAYWGISEEDLILLGKEATAFSSRFLAKGFTGYSRLADAMGNSDRKRYFAMVKVGDQFLCEALVRNGLARVYGRGVTLPDGTAMGTWWKRLRALESKARREGLGGWGIGKTQGRLKAKAVEERDVVLSRDVIIYSVDGTGRYLGRLRRGTSVTLLEAVSATRVRIRFEAEGASRDALCRAVDLGF